MWGPEVVFFHADAVQLLGVRVHTLSLPELLQGVAHVIDHRQQAVIAYANVHVLNVAYQNPRLRDFLDHADVVFCDGVGVQWGARLMGMAIPHRYTPPDWLPMLACLSAERGYSMFLLGGRPGVAEEASNRLRLQCPALRIAGTHHGYFDKRADSPENRAVLREIQAARPDTLLIGFGTPLQEQWLEENWDALPVHNAVLVGAAFDYIAGRVIRAPRFITDNGLEWLARLIVEPRRLWRRYIVGNPLFMGRVLKQRLNLEASRPHKLGHEHSPP
jgi:N-acetylglucosaminyldiphosphoundecaprenol N-acetyl-beta-D-mannosaminyltransferase